MQRPKCKTPDENIGRFGLTGVSEVCQAKDLTSGSPDQADRALTLADRRLL